MLHFLKYSSILISHTFNSGPHSLIKINCFTLTYCSLKFPNSLHYLECVFSFSYVMALRIQSKCHLFQDSSWVPDSQVQLSLLFKIPQSFVILLFIPFAIIIYVHNLSSQLHYILLRAEFCLSFTVTSEYLGPICCTS